MKKHMTLKTSRYNYIVSLENKTVIAFNGVSKAMGKFNPQQFEVAGYVLKNPNAPVSEIENGFSIKSYLIRNGFVLPGHIDEVELLRQRNRGSINGKQGFDLMILPTLDCNFHCIYCYEDHRPVHMSLKVENAIKKWALNALLPYKAVNLSWFGGEPLLKIDTVLRLSDYFRHFCMQNGKLFTNMITTNGYLLTEKNIMALKKAGMKHFHITIDGSLQWHETFRVHKKNKATYARIIQGVNCLLKVITDAQVTIRVNYNKDSFNSIPEVFDLFPLENRHRISLIFRQIFGDYADAGSLPDKSEKELIFYGMAVEKGYGISLSQTLQGPKETYCYADKKGSLIINPEAEIFLCGVGKFDSKSKTGDLRANGTIDWKTDALEKWASVDGFDDPDCRRCRYLPLCMGGCRAARVEKRGKNGCEQPFEMIPEILRLSCLKMGVQ